jgi:F-type H+-transporting ATPase subunit b
MPQLDPTSFAPQLLWLAVSFVVLYLMLARLLVPRVHSVLLFRSRTLTGDIEAAGLMKSQAEEARINYETALADARVRSQQMLDETQAAITARAQAKQAEIDAAIEQKLAAAEVSLRTARNDVMGKLAPVSGELAALIVDAMVHYKPTAQEAGAAVNAIAKERQV